jgi:hypothetical protein
MARQDGTLIVPLDAAPRWLAALLLSEISWNSADRCFRSGARFAVRNIVLAQCRDVVDMNVVLNGGAHLEK